jgi:hypothetical protein
MVDIAISQYAAWWTPRFDRLKSASSLQNWMLYKHVTTSLQSKCLPINGNSNCCHLDYCTDFALFVNLRVLWHAEMMLNRTISDIQETIADIQNSNISYRPTWNYIILAAELAFNRKFQISNIWFLDIRNSCPNIKRREFQTWKIDISDIGNLFQIPDIRIGSPDIHNCNFGYSKVELRISRSP